MKLCVKPIGWKECYIDFHKNIRDKRFILDNFCIIPKGKHYFAVCDGFREITSGSYFSVALKKANLLELGYKIKEESLYEWY